jgi:hypothetical protein
MARADHPELPMRGDHSEAEGYEAAVVGTEALPRSVRTVLRVRVTSIDPKGKKYLRVRKENTEAYLKDAVRHAAKVVVTAVPSNVVNSAPSELEKMVALEMVRTVLSEVE